MLIVRITVENIQQAVRGCHLLTLCALRPLEDIYLVCHIVYPRLVGFSVMMPTVYCAWLLTSYSSASSMKQPVVNGAIPVISGIHRICTM